jgi:hypothetical protein
MPAAGQRAGLRYVEGAEMLAAIALIGPGIVILAATLP